MARWIKTSGEITEVRPKNGRDFSLSELQGFVGGYIELVWLHGDTVMVVNEEGLVKGLPFNANATAIAYQPIVGDVLVCKSKEIK